MEKRRSMGCCACFPAHAFCLTQTDKKVQLCPQSEKLAAQRTVLRRILRLPIESLGRKEYSEE